MKVEVTAYPYAVVFGTIDVPDGEDVEEYINDHFDEIEFGEPELDYCGVDIEFN